MISNPQVVITDYDYGDLEIEKDILHGEGAEVYKVQTSYAFKLLLDEMKSLGVAMRLKLEDRK